MVKDTRIVTISNRIPEQDYYTYHQLFKSVGEHEILVLGQDAGEYTGLSDKPRILYNAIKAGKIPEKKICFVDAWDVVFARPFEEVMERYDSYFKGEVLVGAEKNCFPQNFKREYDRLDHGNSSYRYLNSGVIIGKTEAILTILEAMDAPNLPVDYHDSRKGHNFHFNDQAYYMDLLLRQPVPMILDYDCFIVQNMQDVGEDELEFESNGVVRNKETESAPAIIHWNGGSKTGWSREKILKHLNLI